MSACDDLEEDGAMLIPLGVLLIFFIIWGFNHLSHSKDQENINIPATNLRAASVCETHSSTVAEIIISRKLGGRDGILYDEATSVVRCINPGTGEITPHEIKNVLYRGDTP